MVIAFAKSSFRLKKNEELTESQDFIEDEDVNDYAHGVRL